MAIFDTPWGQKTVTPQDEERSRIVIEMWDDHEAVMNDIAYYNREAIEQHKNFSLSTMDLVEWITSCDDADYKRMVRTMKSVIKLNKDKIKELNRRAVEIEQECNRMRNVTPDIKRQMKEFYTHLHVTLPIAKHQEIINKNQQLLGLCNKDPNVATPELLNFERAKLVPVDSIIQFTRGFAPCIWHDEKSPSMKHYPKNNKVHCFGCGKGGDVIDVVQQLKGCDVKTAVIYLTNGT